MSGPSHPVRRSAAPWLFGLAVLLTVLCPLLFLGIWVAEGTLDGFVPAFLAALADLAAAVVAAVLATVLAARRGITRVRTVVTGHPQGRTGRIAEYHAARWGIARERFAALAREYAAFEADPRAVAARPALVDVTVPATARFVEAYGDAQFLLTDTEPSGPRREEFAAAVDRAVAAWHEAGRTADALAGASGTVLEHDDAPRAVGPARPAGGSRYDREHGRENGQEYTEMAEAVRRAAVRGVRDLRSRMRA